MKTKIIAVMTAATVMLGLVSCSGAASGTTAQEQTAAESETEAVTESESEKETATEATTTTEESTTQEAVAVKKLDLSLEDVSDKLFEVCEGQKGISEPSDDGDILGGIGMWGGRDYWSWALFELDTESDLYQNLKVGDRVSYTSTSGNQNEFVVSAINGQYVLQIAEPIDETNWNNVPPFNSISEAQDVYDAFVALK